MPAEILITLPKNKCKQESTIVVREIRTSKWYEFPKDCNNRRCNLGDASFWFSYQVRNKLLETHWFFTSENSLIHQSFHSRVNSQIMYFARLLVGINKFNQSSSGLHNFRVNPGVKKLVNKARSLFFFRVWGKKPETNIK